MFLDLMLKIILDQAMLFGWLHEMVSEVNGQGYHTQTLFVVLLPHLKTCQRR